jgi:predicted HTH domain antitoxin
MIMTQPTLLGELNLLVTEGVYQTQEALIQDACRSLLRSKPEIKTQLALAMYKRGQVSLTRAAEIAGVDLEGFKDLLQQAGIQRLVPAMGEALTHQVAQLLSIRTG